MPLPADTDIRSRDPDRRVIEDLNAHYVRAAEEGDIEWYARHLADDFVISRVDGALVDRATFIERIRGGSPDGRFEAVDVRVRFVGELALVHAGFRWRKPDGQPGSGRYTDIYTPRNGRWVCVSAHFNRF
jgi:ketosteroid isomerase-like protein